jgi:L-asparaginase
LTANAVPACFVARQVAASPATAALPGGVLVVMNDSIHLAQYVRKADSQLLGAFRSHPGPIGQLRGGQPVFYYAPPPAAAPSFLPDDAFLRLSPAALRTRVAIWPLAVSALLPDSLLGELDGLVLAGSGTGSLPAALAEQLAPWTRRLPIVIASRCGEGANHDDFLYRGSRAKYEDRGFILGRGYEQLNPLQARTLLVLRLSAHGTG